MLTIRSVLFVTVLCLASLAFAQAGRALDAIEDSADGVAVMVSALSAQPAAKPTSQGACTGGDIHALDFLVGDWESATTDLVKDAGTHGQALNHIEALLNGCAILQHRSEQRDGKPLFDSYVIWAFDSAQNRIREFVIDDSQHAQVYEGMWENGGWVFYRDRISEDGNLWTIRVRYTPTPSGFTQTADLTKDRGKTWEKATTTSYIRK